MGLGGAGGCHGGSVRGGRGGGWGSIRGGGQGGEEGVDGAEGGVSVGGVAVRRERRRRAADGDAVGGGGGVVGGVFHAGEELFVVGAGEEETAVKGVLEIWRRVSARARAWRRSTDVEWVLCTGGAGVDSRRSMRAFKRKAWSSRKAGVWAGCRDGRLRWRPAGVRWWVRRKWARRSAAA